jgi:hypothetical protein
MKRITNVSGQSLPLPDGVKLADKASRIVPDKIGLHERVENWRRGLFVEVEDVPEGAASRLEADDVRFMEMDARHRGGGSYSIVSGDEEVAEGLTRREAQSFKKATVSERREIIGKRQAASRDQ